MLFISGEGDGKVRADRSWNMSDGRFSMFWLSESGCWHNILFFMLKIHWIPLPAVNQFPRFLTECQGRQGTDKDQVNVCKTSKTWITYSHVKLSVSLWQQQFFGRSYALYAVLTDKCSSWPPKASHILEIKKKEHPVFLPSGEFNCTAAIWCVCTSKIIFRPSDKEKWNSFSTHS